MSDTERDLAGRELDDLLASGDLERAVQAGEITPTQADELLQQAERRRAAMEGPALDTDAEGLITSGGFGSGQGMAKQQAGGKPRNK